MGFLSVTGFYAMPKPYFDLGLGAIKLLFLMCHKACHVTMSTQPTLKKSRL